MISNHQRWYDLPILLIFYKSEPLYLSDLKFQLNVFELMKVEKEMGNGLNLQATRP